jgi:fucose permease
MRDNFNSKKRATQANWINIGTIGLFFFIFGFITWLNGILIPYLKISCELNHFESYLVAFSFYVAYVIMAIPSSWLLKKTGLKGGMMIGLFVMAAGALLPLLYGRLADIVNPQKAYIVVIPCYLFILYYAIAGHKVGKRAKGIIQMS